MRYVESLGGETLRIREKYEISSEFIVRAILQNECPKDREKFENLVRFWEALDNVIINKNTYDKIWNFILKAETEAEKRHYMMLLTQRAEYVKYAVNELEGKDLPAEFYQKKIERVAA